jgi:hypothetical protein
MNKTLLGALLMVGAATVWAGPVQVTLTSSSGESDSSGYLISPDTALVNGTSMNLYCDDFANDASIGETWSANITSLASGSLSNTRYGGITQTLQTQNGTQTFDGLQLYEMAAWLTTQYGSNATNNGNVQDTIWDLFNPNAGDPTSNPPKPSSDSLLFAAEQNYSSIDAADFDVVTNTAPVTLDGAGQVQEYLITPPEPSTDLMLGFGLIAVAIGGRRAMKRAKLVANNS